MSEPVGAEYVDVPMVVTTGPSVRMSLMWCGRTFRSYLRKPTPRKERYHWQVMARHQRHCTACRRAKRVARIPPEAGFLKQSGIALPLHGTIVWPPLV